MAVPKAMLTEFGIHHRLESCDTWYPLGMPGVDGSVELARPAPRLSALTRRIRPRKPAKASAPEAAAAEEGEAESNRGKASLSHHQQQLQPVGICKDSGVISGELKTFSQKQHTTTHLLVVPAPGGGGDGEGTIPTVGPPGPGPPWGGVRIA